MAEQAEKSALESGSPRPITDFASEFLAEDAVSIVIKQHLLPDDTENPVIFPPTYLAARNKVDDEAEAEKGKKEKHGPIYNLDELGDGRNVVEIDSPQSDGNRTEVLFTRAPYRALVPQIDIRVGSELRSILEAGHRAADALVRFSSLAPQFHEAFERTRKNPPDHSMIATLAPTSLLYGAYDSRSTQAKLQRIIKASIRAEDVRPLKKSATFVPAVDYVAAGAVKEGLDDDAMSSEGMKHALASETLGGVRLTDSKRLVRTIKINLAAIRALNAVPYPVPEPRPLPADPTQQQQEEFQQASADHDRRRAAATTDANTRTQLLQQYVLSLALTVAKATPNLNLREGCNLRLSGDDQWQMIRHRKEDEPIAVQSVTAFAEAAMKNFFTAMGLDPERKDHPDVVFQKGVAEEFLGLTDAKGKPSATERDKVRSLGAVTRETLDKYWADRRGREGAADPKEQLRSLIDKIKVTAGGKKLNAAAEHLRKYLSDTSAAEDEPKGIYTRISEILDGGEPPEAKVSALKAALAPADESVDPAHASPPTEAQ